MITRARIPANMQAAGWRAPFALSLSLSLALACKGNDFRSDDTAEAQDRLSRISTKAADEPMPASPAMEAPMEEEADMDDWGGTGTAMAEGKMGKADRARRGGILAAKKKFRADKSADKSIDGAPGGGLEDSEGRGERGPKTRSWFPETFLFEPLIVTDDRGAASLSVRVPDRLTTWRVLALAHSRQGGQAGTTTSFLGTLPAYVDPVLPSTLRSGDRVRLPVQLVNTTSEPITGELFMEAENAALTGATGALAIPAQSNLVRYATFAVDAPGEARLLARLGNTDSVIRTAQVIPTGRPVPHTESGTLAAARTYALTSPADANPALGRVRLQVFPGALSILRSELASAIERGGVAEDAFALLMAGKAPELLRALGDEPDEDALRTLSILATQRVVRHARTLTVDRATLLADAALSHPENPVLERLGKRAVEYLANNQVPDGTCGGANGWTMQRLLVATADCARAAKGAPTVGVRASGAFERHARLIEDPYTAAAILSSGAVSGSLATTLHDMVIAGIRDRDDGSKVLDVLAGVTRADGVRPSRVEATALAILALEGDDEAPLADLGAAVLSGYSPLYGWGDGRANLVCMQAVLQLFKDPIPEHVRIVLAMDGTPVIEGQLTRDKVREVLTLEAAGLGAAGAHQWGVSAEPPVPGLGFSLLVTNYVPWEETAIDKGLQLIVKPPAEPSVGKPGDVAITGVAPSGQSLQIALEWPAGVQVDTAGLDALVSSGSIARYNASDGKLELFVNPLAPAQVFSANIRVIPTLAGRLGSGASSMKFGGRTLYQRPSTWVVGQ